MPGPYGPNPRIPGMLGLPNVKVEGLHQGEVLLFSEERDRVVQSLL